MSDTRWGSRIKAVDSLISKLGPISTALDEIKIEGTQHNSEKANRLQNSIESFDTIVTAVIIQKVLGYILPLTIRLQSSDVDIINTIGYIMMKEGKESG